jgi:hypothetical protein
LGSFSDIAACTSSLENTCKISLILGFIKNSPQAHTEVELGVLGVHGKLVKYVVHSRVVIDDGRGRKPVI